MFRFLGTKAVCVSRRRSISIILIITLTSLAGVAQAAIDPHNSVDVEARVREYFSDVPAMAAVAKCESGFRQYAADGGVLFDPSYSWIGVFQISRIHLPGAINLGVDIMTLEGNMAYARHLYEAEGMIPWTSSKGCWGKASAGSITGLGVGVVSNKVIELQQLLNRAGFAVARSGPGSVGKETTKFGTLTRDAVRKFQCSKGIVCSGNESTTGYGFVGPRTYAALRAASSA